MTTVSTIQKSDDYSFILKKCDRLLQEDDIRFAGIINRMGKLLAGGFKDEITPLNDETQKRVMCMEVALRTATRRDFDEPLGEVDFAAAKRKKVVMMSFPFSKNILLISAEPDVNIDKTATKIMKIWRI